MSKDLTEALRALMEGDASTNVVPALKPRGAAPAVTSAAPMSGPGKGSSGGGIASPLTEVSFASRSYWPDETITSTDGMVSLAISPIKQARFTDANGATVVFDFARR